MIALTFRAGRDGLTSAAYLGAVRVGYVMIRASGEATWWSTLLQPSGGGYKGIAESGEAAREDLAVAVNEWISHAGLAECAAIASERN
jgi:hypothetical protein